MALIKRNTVYSVNDIVNTRYGTKLKCTTAGTTSTDPLILDGTSPITDGTVVWEVQEEGGGQGLVDYAPNTSYNVGDIVIYDSKIYKCITAHTSTSIFDNTKWQKIGDEVFTGATSSSSGEEGIVPQPTTSDISKFLCGDGTWKSAGGIGLNVIDDILWSGAFNSVVAENTLTLQNDYDDYDEIILYIGGQYSRSFITSLGNAVGYDNDGGSLGTTYSYHIIIVFSGNSGSVVIWQYGTAIASSEVRIIGRKYINPNNYSTTEKEIGTWIDGKKLYQRTISYTIPSGTGLQKLTIETLQNVDIVTEIFGVSEFGVPVNALEQTTYDYSITCWFDTDTKELNMTHHNDGGDIANITIRYTKV